MSEEKNSMLNNVKVLQSTIAVLLLIIIVLAFALGKNGTTEKQTNLASSTNVTNDDIDLNDTDEKTEKNTESDDLDKSSLVVTNGDIVKVHYKGTLEDKTQFDSSYDRGLPLEFQVGVGKMIPGFEAGIMGLKIGDKKTLTLTAKDAYGEYDPTKKEEVPRKELKQFEDSGIELKVGNKIPTQIGEFVILEANDKTITIDVNHPLAGKTLTFDIELVDIERKEEVKGKLEVFLMGYCPFGEIAAKAIPNLQNALKDGMNLDLHYIATKTGSGYSAEDFNSLHGKTEVEEDIRQLCIKKHYGLPTLISYIQKRYENADNYGKVKEEPKIAYDVAKIEATKINSCMTSGEGGKLLEIDANYTQSLGIGASPTWLANNKYQFGGIDAEAVKTSFCKYNVGTTGCDTTIEATGSTSNNQPSCNK